MAGFGAGPFGYGPFGHFDWSKQVLFRDLPELDRQLDIDVSGNRLEKFIDSIRPSFDELLRRADDFTDLRDPDRVRTQFNERITVTILSSVAVGRVIEVTVLDPDPLDPFDPLEFVSVGWLLKDLAGREYKVNAVHKLRPDVIEVTGIADLPAVGAAVLRPMSLIELLGADYGIEVDFHEPEAFQRSSVKNACQWLSIKGTAKSYDILGKIAGYRVTAYGLWAIDSPAPEAIDPDLVFELPAGSGHFYTTVPPLLPRFDEVAADVVPIDTYCWEEHGADPVGTWLSPPPIGGVPDGTTLGDAIGYLMQNCPVTVLTSLGGGRWRITVDPADLTPISLIGQWFFDFGGTRFWLETQPEFLGGTAWRFEAYLGTVSPIVVTDQLDFGYECREVLGCGFCAASVIRVEVIPVEVLTDPDALLEGVLTRLVRKILQVVPAHVRITDIVHIVEVSIPLNISLTASMSPTLFAYGPLGYYYDIVPADELPIDPDHMIVTGTVFTIP